METQLLKLPEVRERVPLSKASIYLKIKRGEFPKPVPLGARAVAWRASAITAWLQAQEEAGKPEQAAAAR